MRLGWDLRPLTVLNLPRPSLAIQFFQQMKGELYSPQLPLFCTLSQDFPYFTKFKMTHLASALPEAHCRKVYCRKTWAQCYGGHQFGNWAGQLGDGRAISLGEVTGPSGKRWELQLKAICSHFSRISCYGTLFSLQFCPTRTFLPSSHSYK